MASTFPWREKHEKDKEIDAQTVAGKTTGDFHRCRHASHRICGYVFTVEC